MGDTTLIYPPGWRGPWPLAFTGLAFGKILVFTHKCTKEAPRRGAGAVLAHLCLHDQASLLFAPIGCPQGVARAITGPLGGWMGEITTNHLRNVTDVAVVLGEGPLTSRSPLALARQRASALRGRRMLCNPVAGA